MPSNPVASVERSVFLVLALLVAAALLPAQGIVPPFDAPVFVGDGQTHFRATLDYDGDGHVDAMSTWFTPGTMVVKGFRNDGAGHLLPDWSVSYPVTTPNLANRHSAVGDFNGDGRDDFVHVVDQFFAVWISNGAGVVPTIVWGTAEPGFIDEVFTADFDGDGLTDFVMREGPNVRAWLMQASGIPTLVSASVIGPGPNGSIFLVDADGDGDQDVGILSFGNGVMTQVGLYLVTTAGLQLTATIPTNVTSFGATPLAGDIDGDGDQDVVLFGGNQNVILRRTGPASFVVEPPVAGSAPATSFVDLDQDGDLDGISILALNFSFGIQQALFSVSWNDGTGVFSNDGLMNCSRDDYFAVTDRVAGSPDLDGDGDPDLVAGNCVYYGRGSATVHPFGTMAYGPRDLIDLDGDGDLDLFPGVMTAGTTFAINPTMRANRGDGTFGPLVVVAPPAPTGFVWKGPGFPGDYDGDGDLDLLLDPVLAPYAGSSTATHFLRNVGCGVFVDQGPTTTPAVNAVLPNSAFNSDLDGDGDLDLVVSVEAAATTKVWFNQGGGSFVAGPAFDVPTVHVADMTGDGLPDLVALPSGVLTIILGPVAASPGSIEVASNANAAAVADFDGDGDLDIFAVGTVARLYPNLGNGSFADAIDFPDLNPPSVAFQTNVLRVLAGDVDGDGLIDVVSCSPAGLPAGAAILRHDGPGGSFGPAVKLVMQPKALVDLDGDGDLDAVQPTTNFGGFAGQNLRFVTPASGSRLQYGAGTAGTGGIVPILGETGPLREGFSCALRITGGLGGASGLLGVGVAPDNSPFLGITLLMVPAFTIPIQLGGTPGVAGEGNFVLSFVMPPSLAGASFFKQAGFADPAGPAGFSATNGLRINVGF